MANISSTFTSRELLPVFRPLSLWLSTCVRTEGRRREVRRERSRVQSNNVERRRPDANCGVEFRGTQICVELVQLKRDSDDVEDASTSADVPAAEMLTASMEPLHPTDDEVVTRSCVSAVTTN